MLQTMSRMSGRLTILPGRLQQSAYSVGQPHGFFDVFSHKGEPQPAFPGEDLDKIHLRGLMFHGYHGVLPEVDWVACEVHGNRVQSLYRPAKVKHERKLGQKFVVDATLYVDLHMAARTDNVHDTVNYADVYRHIKTAVEGRPHNLLETLATQLITDAFEQFAAVQGMRLCISKPHVAVTGVVQSLGIEMKRFRAQQQGP